MINFPAKSFIRRHGVISGLLIFFPASAWAADIAAAPGGVNAPGAAEVIAPSTYTDLETKYIFGFTEGSDIGPEGERAIESDTKIGFGRRQGTYNAIEQEIEYETNPTPDLQIEASVHGVYNQILGVDGFKDFNGANFGGLSTNFRYNLIGRGPGSPIGVTITVEPEWSRVNDGGKVDTSFGATTKLLVDTELVPDRLFAAFNAIYEPEIGRDFGFPDWSKASTFGLTSALTYRILPNVTLGGEFEYYRVNNSLGFDGFAGHALYAGPTLFVQITNKILAAVAFSTEIAGHAEGVPGPLDLTDFARNKARLLVEVEF